MAESPQSDWRRELDPRRSPWVSLLAGLLFGLLLGLLIGWVLWPVSWTNAAPGDLSADARADYLSAVADAYVSGRNLPARELARQRLRYFGDETAQAGAIAAARLWYGENQPDEWRVRTSNLNELASALGLATLMDPATPAADEADQGGVPGEGAASVSATPAGGGAPDITAVPDRGEPVGSEPGWLAWFLVTLTALVLIAGGLYMLRRLYETGRASPGELAGTESASGAWTGEDDSGALDSGSLYAGVERELEARVQESKERQVGESGAGVTFADDDVDEYGFEDEADDIPTAGTLPVSFQSDAVPAAPGSSEPFPAVDDADAAFVPDSQDESMSTAESRSVMPGDPVAMPHHPAVGETQQGASRRADSGRLLDRFTAHYQFGIPDYDQAFNIREGDSSNIIGACGMGVNIKGGILRDNPENVVALDVWLFDKVNPSKPITETVVLVPRSPAEHDQTVNGNALVAEPGTRFQLEAGHLVMTCTIEQVSISDHPDSDGIFRDVKVAMAVARR